MSKPSRLRPLPLMAFLLVLAITLAAPLPSVAADPAPDACQVLDAEAAKLLASGDHAAALATARQARTVAERTHRPVHLHVANALLRLARVEGSQSNDPGVERLYLAGIDLLERLPRTASQDALEGARNSLGAWYELSGQTTKAETLWLSNLADAERHHGTESRAVGGALMMLVMHYRGAGNPAAAIPHALREVALDERHYGPDDAITASSLEDLAGLYASLGDTAHAEPLQVRAAAIRAKAAPVEANGASTPDPDFEITLLRSTGHAHVLDLAKAEPALLQALALSKQHYGINSSTTLQVMRELATVYVENRVPARAEPLYADILSRYRRLGLDASPDYAAALAEFGYAQLRQRKYREAMDAYREASGLWRLYGMQRTQAAWLANASMILGMEGNLLPAIDYSRKAIGLLRDRYAEPSATANANMESERAQDRWLFVSHLSKLRKLLANYPNPPEVVGESFETGQLAQASAVGQTAGYVAARFARGSDALAGLLRAQQDDLARITTGELGLAAALGQPQATRDSAAETRLRYELDDARRHVRERAQVLAQQHPEYLDLVNQAPMPIDAVGRLLAEDEALVSYAVSRLGNFAWVVRRDTASFHALAIDEAGLAALVGDFRSKLQSGESGMPQAMAPADGRALHQALFAFLEPELKGIRRLLLVPDGILRSVPFGALGAGDPANPEWLAKHYSITVLPSVANLRGLRSQSRRPPASASFVGFGDPVLNGSAGTTLSMRAVAGMPAVGMQRGPLAAMIADQDALRGAPELPDTGLELRQVAKLLDAPAESLFLRERASETLVKGTDLSRYRVVSFATHGVLAGELTPGAEPGLVLTPPAVPSAHDDGFLAASEIAQLRLNAEWVLLSACNTAASDGSAGAEGLSGLAKAFMHAGSNALLVSHWRVSSEATTALIVRTIEEYARSGEGSKANALRAAMLALMEEPRFSHPYYWAGFSLVGE